MEVKICGAGRTVTGSCYKLKVGNKSILVDCGMFQGGKSISRKNYEPFPFEPSEIDALILTHAHLDHCGRIPKLFKQGFTGKIYCTTATEELSKIVMLDAAHIQEMDTEHENRRRVKKGLPEREPLFKQDDAKRAFENFSSVKYHNPVQITNNIRATYYDAGHILGAASVRLEIDDEGETKTIIFSGDVGQYGSPIVNDPEPNVGADYLFTESTYGDRLHEPIKNRRQELLDAIKTVEVSKGKLLIPSFSIERTQELLFDMNELFEKNLVRMPVFLDSPMAIKATEVFKKFPDYYDPETKAVLDSGDNPFSFPQLEYSSNVQDSIKLKSMAGPIIIIAGSGMCTAGRIKHHIKNHISDSSTTILFVGYQSPGTLGSYIKGGSKTARMLGKEIPVNAKVMSIDSFSGHADYASLLTWTKRLGPIAKKVFVCHGDEDSAQSYSEKLESEGYTTYIPHMDEELNL